MRTKPLHPNSMQMIMENFKRFANRTENCGSLYLFEDDEIKIVSFEEHFNQLNESDEAIKVFLENWEKSSNYQLDNLMLSEELTAAQKARFAAIQPAGATAPEGSAQGEPEEGALEAPAWLDKVAAMYNQAIAALGKYKDRAAAPVLRVIGNLRSKLKGFEEKHPKLYKFLLVATAVAALVATAILIHGVIEGGGSGEEMDQVAQQAAEADVPEVAAAAEKIANASSPEAGVQAVNGLTDEARQRLEALPGMAPPEAAPIADVIQQAPDVVPPPPPEEDALDWFAQAMEEKTRTGGDLGADLGATMDAGEDPSAWFEQAMEDKQLEKIDDWYETTYGANEAPSSEDVEGFWNQLAGGGDPGDGGSSLIDTTTAHKGLASQLKQELSPKQIKALLDQLEDGNLKGTGRRALRQLARSDITPAAAKELAPAVAWAKKYDQRMPGLEVWLDNLKSYL